MAEVGFIPLTDHQIMAVIENEPDFQNLLAAADFRIEDQREPQFEGPLPENEQTLEQIRAFRHPWVPNKNVPYILAGRPNELGARSFKKPLCLDQLEEEDDDNLLMVLQCEDYEVLNPWKQDKDRVCFFLWTYDEETKIRTTCNLVIIEKRTVWTETKWTANVYGINMERIPTWRNVVHELFTEHGIYCEFVELADEYANLRNP